MIVGLDIETTGLDYKAGHKVIELAMLKFDPKGNLLDRYVQRFDPQRSCDAAAYAVHQIDVLSLIGSPKLIDEVDQIRAFLSDAKLVVAHNGNSFDRPFIEHEFGALGEPFPTKKWVDTMLLGRWATPFGKLPSLKELAFACDVQYDNALAHAAEYDVNVMMNCFFRAFSFGHFREFLNAA